MICPFGPLLEPQLLHALILLDLNSKLLGLNPFFVIILHYHFMTTFCRKFCKKSKHSEAIDYAELSSTQMKIAPGFQITSVGLD